VSPSLTPLPAALDLTPAIALQGVYKRFPTPSGQIYTALRNINLTIAPGEFCAVVGPTGCGKSTTLTLVAGLERPSAGDVRVMGRPVDGIGKDIGYVFQSDAVFPWKSVLNNVAAGPLFRGASKKEAYERARDWINRVGLSGFESYYPHQVSGGMRKRVALAQCLITEPRIVLMDEPFSALDVQTRALMENELLNISGRHRAWIGHPDPDHHPAEQEGDRAEPGPFHSRGRGRHLHRGDAAWLDRRGHDH